jgi:ABC-2 type transport system ATP-binding protein
MDQTAIRIEGLTHYYGKKKVVDQLSLEIPRGGIFGLLGRNGAGKTTTIRILMGLLQATRGTAQVLGCDSRRITPEIRAQIGYLAEGHHVYGWMTIAECGQFQKSFFKHWNDAIFKSIIDHFKLPLKAKAGNLSRGQRAGLCLALTLAPEPELLVLDDPALGLDPVARRSLLESMVYVTRGKDRTILFSSHLLSDVERVADRIAVMKEGQLKAHCTIEEFRGWVRQYILRFETKPPAAPERPWLLHSIRTDHELAVTAAGPAREIHHELESLGARAIEEIDLSLEDAFISFVGDRGEKTFFLDNLEGKK